MTMPFYYEDAHLIAEITKTLNATKTSNDGYYIHVELRERDTFRVVGEWSDEIAPDAWSFNAKSEEAS